MKFQNRQSPVGSSGLPLLSYMRLLYVRLGLLFNLREVELVDGILGLVLPGANRV
jgi:hypothetical protein